jgi:glucuronoarabinoxylan endo-1,4-beta-xylanase
LTDEEMPARMVITFMARLSLLRRGLRVRYAFIVPTFAVAACGGARANYEDDDETEKPSTASEDPRVIVDTQTRYQELEGFGAAVAWYHQHYTRHPNREQLKNVLFRELGLDILRLRNQHRPSAAGPDDESLEIYEDAVGSLGHPPRVLLSSWSPPADLKANGATDCKDLQTDCTLRKDAEGTYVYDAFGEYWADALEAYRIAGLDPYYISIQNEPDYTPEGYGWEACRFDAEESELYPGYDRALDAVTRAFDARGLSTRLLGPENAQIGSGRVQRYVDRLDTNSLYGAAFHLYGGGSWSAPASYRAALSAIGSEYPDLPRFQTEFSPTTSSGAAANEAGFEVASLIHEHLTAASGSAYLHWELFWPTSGLVSIENPANAAAFTSPDGFTINPAYFAMRHYSRYTDPGYRRVSVTSNRSTILASGFLSVDDSTLTVVLLNSSSSTAKVELSLGGFGAKHALLRQTTEDEAWATLVASTDHESTVTLPSRSMTTVVLTTNDELPE